MRTIYNNQEILSKAAITTGSFTTGIGLSQEEADRFLDFVIDESGLKDKVRMERITTRDKLIDVVNLGGKVLKPAVEAVDPGETVSITTRQIKLTGKEVIAVMQISDDSLEDNIEGDAFADHLLGMVARATANELESALLYGRKTLLGSNTIIEQLWDGWVKLIEGGGHVVDANGAGFSDRFIERAKLSKLIKSLPTKFRRNKRNLSFRMADDIDQDWSDLVVQPRETQAGDRSLQTDEINRYRGITLDASGLFRTDRPIPVSGGGSTTLDNTEAAGSTVFEVPSTTNFTVGDRVTLGRGGPEEETLTIQSISVDTSLTMTSASTLEHGSGDTVEEVLEDATDTILTDYRNLILGISRDVRIEADRLPRKRATDWVVTMRLDPQIEEADAAAILTNLKSK